MAEPFQNNPWFKIAGDFVNFTGKNIFLTGKAGTGKTTFLKHIRDTSPKSHVVLAPTGVAAMNAGGSTLHSFFQLPFGMFQPEGMAPIDLVEQGRVYDKSQLFAKTKLRQNKIKMIRELELLIIDEVSMVRADLMDAIDTILKRYKNRPQPFGGVQVLCIGDLYQLPPVVKEQEWRHLQAFYPSPFFFDSRVFREHAPLCIELEKVYRQSDADFIEVLNAIRKGQVKPSHLEFLHQRYQPDFKPDEKDPYVILTSHNQKAQRINQAELDRLSGSLYRYEAEQSGQVKPENCPAEAVLELKAGAQVIFIKNDIGDHRRYYNGKMGQVTELDQESISIKFPGESTVLKLEQQSWDTIAYRFNEEKESIEEEVIGQLKQFPVKLAYAITIHKSQGLTFDKAIVDAGASFAEGQVYVALSRLRSMEGLVLWSKIQPSTIMAPEDVIRFMEQKAEIHSLEALYQKEFRNYLIHTMTECFHWSAWLEQIKDFQKSLQDRSLPHPEKAERKVERWLEAMQRLQPIGESLLKNIRLWVEQNEQERLIQKVEDGVAYFRRELKEAIGYSMKDHLEETLAWSRGKLYRQDLHELFEHYQRNLYRLEKAGRLVEGLKQPEKAEAILQKEEEEKQAWKQQLATTQSSKKKKKKGETYQISLTMFQEEGLSPEAIAEQRGLSVGAILKHLGFFIEEERLDAKAVVPDPKFERIAEIILNNREKTFRQMLPKGKERYYYGEFRIVAHVLGKEGRLN